MNTYYATTFESEHIVGETIKTKCACGETSGIVYEKQALVIVCDSCYEAVSNYERFYISKEN